MVRVRILQDCREVRVAATEPVWVKSGSDLTSHPVPFPSDPGSIVKLSNGTWVAGGVPLGGGELTLTPGRVASMSVNGSVYRGRYRLVPVTGFSFDVINDVDVDSYLKSVLPKELYSGWSEEAYKAQAIAARTYAIYESRTAGAKRHWDLYADQRSQMYGGMAAESSKSIRAVDETAGVVAAYGPAGKERIFKAYFSSTCGGRTQSARDAFGDEYIQPLSEQNRGTICSISPKFNWGPVTIGKNELSRRFAVWAKRKSEAQGTPRPELKMDGVARIEQAFLNSVKRPVYFYVTDRKGAKFLMRAEEVRSAISTDHGNSEYVFSSDFNVIDEGSTIRFIDGHGFGHGVGLCQFCAQRLATEGWRHEDIVVWSYPGAKLIRAY